MTFEEWKARFVLEHERYDLDVGPEKPVGYVGFEDLEGAFAEAKRLREKGLPFVMLTDEYDRYWLMAYDEGALRKLLDANKNLLKASHWPREPSNFVMFLFARNAKRTTPLFDLVADAFGDKTNVLRTDTQTEWREEAIDFMYRWMGA